jgi:cation diffusion facilitator CzcD-associated flavoprotein CzcO
MPAPQPSPTDVDVAIVGAGFAGIGMAIRLREAGIDDVVILERGDRVGGTWRDNTYPGAACDVPSHLYSFSWAQPRWSRRYSGQAEILGYLEGLVRTHGLGPLLRLGTTVRAAVWDEAGGRWVVTTETDERITARVLVSAVGQLNRPAWPDIPGRERFEGRTWHSARWDHDADLAGARVATVGTGASAIQFVPEVARRAARLHVFQRSAPYILPKPDRRYAGWESQLFARVPGLRRADRMRVFVLGELLTSGYVNPARSGPLVKRWRTYLDASVTDPELHAKCIPDYQVGCKRIGFSSEWYPTLNRPNVELVTDPIAEITAEGVVTADGRHRDVDVIVWGTGFRSTEFLVPMTVRGREGRDLHEQWAGGAEAFLGVTVAHFPNFFLLYGPNTNLGANSIIYMLESQIAYAVGAVTTLRRQGLASMEVGAEAQRQYVEWMSRASAATTYASGCHSWYTTASGRNTNNWPDYTFRYRRRLRRVDLRDFRLG